MVRVPLGRYLVGMTGDHGKNRRGTSRRALLAAPLVFALPGRPRAQPPRPGAAPAGPARVRLLGALPVDGGRLIAGVHIALERGWKTYWRHPGDSGIPPVFDWSRAQNAASIEVLYPAPRRMSDGFGDILGYTEAVVFPVRVTPRDAARPVRLALSLAFGVCERVCVPASAAAELEIGRASPSAADAALLTAALDRIPRAVPPGAALPRWAFDASAARLDFQARLEGGVDHVVVEGPEEWRLPLPRLGRRHGDGTLEGSLRAQGMPAGAGRIRPVLVTVVGPHGAAEELRHLD